MSFRLSQRYPVIILSLALTLVAVASPQAPSQPGRTADDADWKKNSAPSDANEGTLSPGESQKVESSLQDNAIPWETGLWQRSVNVVAIVSQLPCRFQSPERTLPEDPFPGPPDRSLLPVSHLSRLNSSEGMKAWDPVPRSRYRKSHFSHPLMDPLFSGSISASFAIGVRPACLEAITSAISTSMVSIWRAWMASR